MSEHRVSALMENAYMRQTKNHCCKIIWNAKNIQLEYICIFFFHRLLFALMLVSNGYIIMYRMNPLKSSATTAMYATSPNKQTHKKIENKPHNMNRWMWRKTQTHAQVNGCLCVIVIAIANASEWYNVRLTQILILFVSIENVPIESSNKMKPNERVVLHDALDTIYHSKIDQKYGMLLLRCWHNIERECLFPCINVVPNRCCWLRWQNMCALALCIRRVFHCALSIFPIYMKLVPEWKGKRCEKIAKYELHTEHNLMNSLWGGDGIVVERTRKKQQREREREKRSRQFSTEKNALPMIYWARLFISLALRQFVAMLLSFFYFIDFWFMLFQLNTLTLSPHGTLCHHSIFHIYDLLSSIHSYFNRFSNGNWWFGNMQQQQRRLFFVFHREQRALKIRST